MAANRRDSSYLPNNDQRATAEAARLCLRPRWDTSEDYSDCPTNDWLFQIGWTMTSYANYYSGVFYTEGEGSLVQTDAYYTKQVHPVVFLKSNITIASGNGSSSQPYILQS